MTGEGDRVACWAAGARLAVAIEEARVALEAHIETPRKPMLAYAAATTASSPKTVYERHIRRVDDAVDDAERCGAEPGDAPWLRRYREVRGDLLSLEEGGRLGPVGMLGALGNIQHEFETAVWAVTGPATVVRGPGAETVTPPEHLSSADSDRYEWAYYGDDRDNAYRAAAKTSGQVYTQIDDADDPVGISYERGYHLVNRTGYYIVITGAPK